MVAVEWWPESGNDQNESQKFSFRRHCRVMLFWFDKAYIVRVLVFCRLWTIKVCGRFEEKHSGWWWRRLKSRVRLLVQQCYIVHSLKKYTQENYMFRLRLLQTSDSAIPHISHYQRISTTETSCIFSRYRFIQWIALSIFSTTRAFAYSLPPTATP